MQLSTNRYITLGMVIALLTTATAFLGAPKGLEEFTVPVWELLLQFNLCSGFVFLTIGLLESAESPSADTGPTLQLFSAAFVSYQLVCLSAAAGVDFPVTVKLLLFAFSLACIAAGWAQFGLSMLRQLDKQG